MSLAQNLYSSSAKFVFELLQNYDDNHYDSDRGPPSVSFHIYPDRIVASCNENGFTAENVTAICSVGRSSKKQTQSQLAGDMGYTGEKGIGFKSVFMAAEEVHIQSGDYSFRFKYPKGDSGLGMTTPIWTDHDETLDAQLSHITLTLRSDGQPGDAARRQEIIHEQFHNIHDSILLFMKKLQEIKVSFYDSEENLESTTAFSIDRLLHQTTVKKSVTTFDNQNQEQVTEFVKSYIMIKHIVTDLAQNENRKDLDGEAHTTTDGVVVLGFPIDTHSEPVLQNEYIFAFLPVKMMGFKFLIHADFVTQANREDIVVTSDRNHGLARGIAEAFITAVSQFSTHTTLQYQWMRYLPRDSDYPWDRFWKGVIQDIRSRLGRMAILQSQDTSQPLMLISDSRRLLPSMLDSDGKPLVPDIEPNRHLSQGYQDKDLILLEDYGLKSMSNWEWVERVKHDLASDASVMKLTDDEDWHTRVADLLYASFDSESEAVREAVQQLQLFPLRDGSWVSVSPGPVYYPQPEGTSLVIPLRVNLAVVDATAIANVSRERLFNKLGARAAPVKIVREAIFKEHQKTGKLDFTPYDYDRLLIGPHKGYMMKSCNADIDMYIADGTPYGVEILLPSDNGAPGFEPIFIMKDAYFKDILSLPTPTSPTFKDWLHIFHGAEVQVAGPGDGLVEQIRHCESTFPDLYVQELSNLRNFFSTTLQIRDADWRDLLSEIAYKFTKKELIYVTSEDDPDDGDWYTPNQCLWTSVTKIRGMVTLSVLYPDLKNRITSELHLDQDGKVLKVERAAATFHIQEDDTSVKFYVPQDETTQELCFNATLPKSICLWMMANPKTTIVPDMVSAAQAILCAKCVAMNVILDHHGIKLVPVPEGEDDDEEEEIVPPQPSIEDLGRPSIEELGRPSIEELGKPFTEELGRPSIKELGRPSTEELGRPSIEETVRPSVKEPGRPQLVDEVAVNTRSISLASVPRQRVATFYSDEEEIISSRSNTPFTIGGQAESRGGGMTPDYSFTFAPPTTATAASIVTTSTTVTDDGELYLSSLLARTHISTDSVSPVPQAQASVPSLPDDSYSVLLDLVVKAATQASIPSCGKVSVSNMPNTGAQRDNRWFQNATLDEKYKQIGAAGELFVYALLSHMGNDFLPGFSLQNWQSTIRGYACSHPLYSDIQNWVGQETADITYEDVDGTLTALLMDKGYLASEVWASARPRYYIEVKTTVNAAVATPFYMSNHQYTRMQNCSLEGPNDNHALENVYMIIRVFGLGAGFVGFQLLVDPESMRRRGELAFTAPESWTVVVL
ncbi:hypothetical protein SEUCBS140593_009123 [Sporothrix eucalyptigena]|uniref:Protein NO VEIN C-terminal domain-containing protein n=1 Tax=Sporothrix eucalyptigena TaxID=1812306 RepID=A0ABP0CUJ1_9PEZI